MIAVVEAEEVEAIVRKKAKIFVEGVYLVEIEQKVENTVA